MVIFDWYDGPTSGILVCEECGTAYLFVMVDWDKDHELRIFSLAPLPGGSLDAVITFFQEPAKWPIWFPERLKVPTAEFRAQMDVLDRIIDCAGEPTIILAWNRSARNAVVAKYLPSELIPMVKSWFDLEDGHPLYDWFAYMGFER